MNRRRALVRFGCLSAALLLLGCARNREFENWSPTVPGSHFKTIATMSGGSERGDERSFHTAGASAGRQQPSSVGPAADHGQFRIDGRSGSI